ncbi:MAG: hypothetical protein H7178_09230 [Chitinophagaceae bacterium]|nr:hypothetical protein [Chitinophagaceae bacterium]
MATTHLSIVSISIRPEIQEKISIGLYLFDDKKVLFHYSKNKLEIIKELFNKSVYAVLKDSLKNIFSSIDSTYNSDHSSLSFLNSVNKPFNNKAFINYLSSYNNNLVVFSNPIKIDLPLTNEVFQSLYKKYIDDNIVELHRIVKPLEDFKKNYYPKLEHRFNVEKEVTRADIANLMFPVKVSLLGKNDIPVFGQTIDFERNMNHIEADFADLIFLKKAFDSTKTKSKSFLIASEPSKVNYPKQHSEWKYLMKIKEFEYIDVKDAPFEIENYATSHNVKPFIATPAAITGK